MAMCTAALLGMGTLSGCAGTAGQAGESSVSQESETEMAQGAGEQSPEPSTGVQQSNRILLKDIDTAKYVKVGDYQNLRVSKSTAEVADSEVDEAMQEHYFANFPTEKGIMDRAVEVGDTVSIDYEGKKDGVAFYGGTAQGYPLTIGSHSFIDGFEDGLVGVMPGETVDLNLTFPEVYSNAELAGKDVVFTVKVNCIIPAEIADEIVPHLGIENVSNLEELRKYHYDTLYEQKVAEIDAYYDDEIFSKFMALCTFEEMPAELLESSKTVITEAISATASQYGLDADTFVGYAYGTDLNTFLEYYAEPSLQQNVALYTVAQAENLIPSDEEIKKVVQDYATEAGYEDGDAYLTALGATFEEFKEDYAITLAYDKVLEIAKQ